MPSRDALDKLFDNHDHKYQSATGWREGMKQAIMAWASPDRAQVREEVTAILDRFLHQWVGVSIDGMAHAITDAVCGEARPTWCEHCRWQEAFYRGTDRIKSGGYYLLNGTLMLDVWKFCPLCTAPRPPEPT